MAKAKGPSDISQLIIFPAQDDQWIKKILIGSVMILLSFIPIIPALFLLGYYSEIIRQIVVEGKSPSLPEWDDLGKFFQDGIKLFGVGFIYMIPQVIL